MALSTYSRDDPINEPDQPIDRITDKLETPSLDDRSYRVVRLANQLECLLVHDPETDKTSATLDVNVGNFSDEDNMPGMAHAVEHLLFMGTKKYPVEYAYNQYLSGAFRPLKRLYWCNFHKRFFEVGAKSGEGEESSESPLYGALNRFAQFFIEPLFLSSTWIVGLQAVDSENKKNLQSDPVAVTNSGEELIRPKAPLLPLLHSCVCSAVNPLDVLERWAAEAVLSCAQQEPASKPPGQYISHLIEHDGPGSVFSYIKSKGWANSLSAGVYAICPGTPGVFDCQVRLTKDGLMNYKEIVKVFFQYVTLLRETPPQEWIFESRRVWPMDFKFKQKTPASQFTGNIAAVMPKPLPESGYSGQSRLRKDYPGDWDQKEKWYGTECKAEKKPEEFLVEISKAANADAKRDLVQKDDTFWVPRANLVVSFKNPIIFATAENSMKAKLYTDLTLKDPANVNHCIEYYLHIGSKGDRMVRAKTQLLDQIVHEPAFDQLRTKERLGYVVFSGLRGCSATYGFSSLFRVRELLNTQVMDRFVPERSSYCVGNMSDTEIREPQEGPWWSSAWKK
ncbi:uncharacterized protein PG998_014771 [Apiospora kogelbergensis]|uniref:uncharacterized protein n=1 Tax=Apiospora kogelbergensis TaxID=1337665 RepID=UPI00312E9DDF